MTEKENIADLLNSIDRRPYVDLDGFEKREKSAIEQIGISMALGYVGLKGYQWTSTRSLFNSTPETLAYLNAGLSTEDNPFWRVAGLTPDSEGKIVVNAKLAALEAVKRAEEGLGGIPRTFGLFGAMSQDVFTNENTYLRITAEDLVGAESHYEALIKQGGHKLEALDKVRGFVVKPSEEGLGIFRVLDDGVEDTVSLVDNVRVGVRRWFPEGQGVTDAYQQVVRMADRYSEAMGAERISHQNPARFFAHRAPGEINLRGAAGEALEAFGVRGSVEDLINSKLTQGAHERLRDASIAAAGLAERAARVLDSPLEAIEEVLYGGPRQERGLIGKAKDSKVYGALRNLAGAGGDYSGGATDILARHAGKLALLTAGIAVGYQATSYITEALFNRSADQAAGEVVGAAERLYAASSDMVGLTTLNKEQEAVAPGSGRLSGALSFGLSGYITGHFLSGAMSRIDTPDDEFRWAAVRRETHDTPTLLGKQVKGVTRGKAFGIVGGVLGLAASSIFLPGALGSSRSLEEVIAEQSGDVEVAVRKGRYWEAGRTDIEGEDVEYYRPNWFARLQDDSFDELQYGDYGDRPVSRFIKGIVDPYWREKEMYYQRPYPVTGPDTSGFGVLGTLWGATIGQVLKPAAFMHTGEISTGGYGGAEDGEVISFRPNVSESPSEELGGYGPARVVSPYSSNFLLGEGLYKATEAVGLPGFALSALKKRITGDGDWGTNEPVLASFSEVGGVRDNFWDMSVGGAATTSESFRRLFPSERFQLEKVNPILNEMPSWLPGAGSFTDFQHGDPYQAVSEGEYRLPGAGYENRFPELEGLDPEDYPDIHKYKILADVAPYSKQLTEVRKRVMASASSGELSPTELTMFQGTEAQLIDREKKIDFAEPNDSLVGNYWSALKNLGRANPVEHLIPFSPVHKFAGATDAISEYEMRNVYSTGSPDWSAPVEDFIMPAINSPLNYMGFDFTPTGTKEKRDLTGYFDKLEYMKYKKLEATAREQGVSKAAFAYARKSKYTMFGADPYGTVEEVMKVLPKSERTFFREFLETSDPEEKGKILGIVPEYTKKFYLAQWQKQTYSALAMKGDLTGEEQDFVSGVEAARALEGEVASEGLFEQYQDDQWWGDVRQNSFQDYARAEKLGRYFEEAAPLPEPERDWLGYNPDVNLKSVKLNVVQQLGKDYHDFDLWESDYRASRSEPYVDVASKDLLSSSGENKAQMIKSLQQMNLSDLDVDIVPSGGDRSRIIFDVGTDRSETLKRELERYGIRRGE